MLKTTHMAACLVATALAAAPAFGQSTPAPSGGTDRPTAAGSGSTTSGSSAMQPGASPSMGGASSGASSSTSGSGGTSASGTAGQTGPTLSDTSTSAAQGRAGTDRFVTQQQGGQWLASKLIGTTVVSANNESIGDVNDVLLDRNGQAAAVIIGVGGFLGIGEKDVAVAFDQLEFTTRDQASRSGTGSEAATTGSTTGTGARQTAGAPERIMLRMTKQDLENAPKFARAGTAGDKDQARAPGATGGDRGTTATAPAAPGGSNAAPRQ